jgi:hypothetical protein
VHSIFWTFVAQQEETSTLYDLIHYSLYEVEKKIKIKTNRQPIDQTDSQTNKQK